MRRWTTTQLRSFLKSCAKQYDVIFSDAPYDLEGSEEVIRLVFERGLLREGGMLIFEHSKGKDFSAHPHFSKLRSYGSVQFSIFELPETEDTEEHTAGEATEE